MFSNRRVVTGTSAEGKAVFVYDGEPQREVRWSDDGPPAIQWIWSTEETPVLAEDVEDQSSTFTDFFPGPRGTRFMIETFPPGFGVDDADRSPDYLSRLEAAGIGMNMDVSEGTVHATSTIDYGVVLTGRIWLELDNGVETELRQGNCVVQTGTAHSWRNRSSEPCTVAFVLVGAHRPQPSHR
jgi:mannose-6-phosphate isomerase-like protein (cupin superfamily)